MTDNVGTFRAEVGIDVDGLREIERARRELQQFQSQLESLRLVGAAGLSRAVDSFRELGGAAGVAQQGVRGVGAALSSAGRGSRTFLRGPYRDLRQFGLLAARVLPTVRNLTASINTLVATGTLGGLRLLAKGVRRLGQSARGAGQQFRNLFGGGSFLTRALAVAAGITVVFAALRGLRATLFDVTAAVARFGINFNRELESARLGIPDTVGRVRATGRSVRRTSPRCRSLPGCRGTR